MATKKTETGKKATPNARTATPAKKTPMEAPDLETMPDEIKTLAAAHEPKITLLPSGLMNKIMEDVTDLMLVAITRRLLTKRPHSLFPDPQSLSSSVFLRDLRG